MSTHSQCHLASFLPQNMFNLQGRVALVTGGGTGIGLMIARGMAASGAKVYIIGRRFELLLKVAEEWKNEGQGGGQIIPLQMDITKKDSIMTVKKTIEQNDGKLHVLVNNAGTLGPMSTWFGDDSSLARQNPETTGLELFNNETLEEWHKLYEANTFSVFFVTNAFMGLLAEGSKDIPSWWSTVILISSISAWTRLSQTHFCYNSSKAAASHITNTFATEFAIKKIPIRVNTITPGLFSSELTAPEDAFTEELIQKCMQGVQPVPMRRHGAEQEMAGTAVYLASRAGGYVTGQDIAVDGGFVTVNP